MDFWVRRYGLLKFKGFVAFEMNEKSILKVPQIRGPAISEVPQIEGPKNWSFGFKLEINNRNSARHVTNQQSTILK